VRPGERRAQPLAQRLTPIAGLRPRPGPLDLRVEGQWRAERLSSRSYIARLYRQSYGASNVLSATLDGLVYGVLALCSRSLVPAVLAHGLYDSGWAVCVLLHSYKGRRRQQSAHSQPAAAAAAASPAPRRSRRRAPDADEQEPAHQLAGLAIYAKPTFDAVAAATAALDPDRRR
jgi:hypothetical protein